MKDNVGAVNKMEELKKKIKTFLKNNGFLPVDELNWCHFEIEHKEKEPDNNIKRCDYRHIKNNVGIGGGIYIYEEKNTKRIIYIGESGSLEGRLEDHYRESYTKLPNGAKGEAWNKFFSCHIGILKVHWKREDDMQKRKVVEAALDYMLAPKFKEFYVMALLKTAYPKYDF